MWIYISGQQIDNLTTLGSGIVTVWRGWCREQGWLCIQRWRWLWYQLCALVACRCSCSFVSPVFLQFCVVPICQGRLASVRLWGSITGCLWFAAMTILCAGNLTLRVFYSRTLEQGFLITYWGSTNAEHEHPSLAILAWFNARCMWDSSSCTRPPCLAMVAALLKTYLKIVAGSNNEIWLIFQPYTLP